jgi:hypothetical protein
VVAVLAADHTTNSEAGFRNFSFLDGGQLRKTSGILGGHSLPFQELVCDLITGLQQPCETIRSLLTTLHNSCDCARL